MSLDADLIVDRRRMRRKLTFWRVIAIGVIVLAVAGVAALGSNRAGFTGVRPYIARVTIEGLIRGDRDRVQALDRLARSSLARAVIIHVDSPGALKADIAFFEERFGAQELAVEPAERGAAIAGD